MSFHGTGSRSPRRQEEAGGLVKEIKGNLITIETGQGAASVYTGPEGVRKEGEWQELQVVVTQETKIYRRIPLSPEEWQRGGEIRERAEEITVSDIHPNDQIEVWGERTDGKVVAQVIYVREPFGGR